jgi:hypothetical protein
VVNMAMGQLVRQLWTGVAAATVAGLLSVVITRLSMRAVAHLVNGTPLFSLGSSAFVALRAYPLKPGSSQVPARPGMRSHNKNSSKKLDQPPKSATDDVR